MSFAEPSPSRTRDDDSPRLPLELLAHIVKDAVADLVEEECWKEATVFCLVSAGVRPFAEEALYRIITLSDGYDAKASSFVGSGKLLDTLEKHPRLSKLVREVRLDVWDRAAQEVLPGLGRALELCPCGRFRGRDTAIRWSAIACLLQDTKAIERLQSININTFRNDHVTPSILSSAKSLRRLDLSLVFDQNLPPAPPLNLTSLSVSGHFLLGGGQQAILNYFLGDGASLLHLKIISPSPALDLSGYSILRSLHIRVFRSGLRSSAALDSADVLKTCSTRTSLVGLTLSAVEDDVQATVDHYETSSLLSQLPRTLTHLDLCTLPFSLASLLAYLETKVSPALGRLDISRLKGEEERRTLEETCWSRGVELYSFEPDNGASDESEDSEEDSEEDEDE